jgi:hypothetical protein
VRIPEVAAMARRGMLPDDLLGVASRFVTTGIKLDTASPEDRLRYAEMTRHMVAGMIRVVRSEDGAWEDVTVTPDHLDALELPPDDLRLLELVAMRQTTPAVANASSRAIIAQERMAGLLTADDLDRDAPTAPDAPAGEDEEAGATVTGWATFPGQPEGAVDREDGGAVQPEPGPGVPGAG